MFLCRVSQPMDTDRLCSSWFSTSWLSWINSKRDIVTSGRASCYIYELARAAWLFSSSSSSFSSSSSMKLLFVLVTVWLFISLHVCSVFITGREGWRVGCDINPPTAYYTIQGLLWTFSLRYKSTLKNRYCFLVLLLALKAPKHVQLGVWFLKPNKRVPFSLLGRIPLY